MSELIQLLPDHIANQIAAGEVVQRPASAVKELLENAIDAGATKIELNLRDAGKALVQVMDNGSGMSARDARMAFERHATSKIRTSDDLFRIQTMGFRGEALASIAAVAQVELKTRLHNDELGTEIQIEGGEFKKQEAVVAKTGTCISVKNLFFNVPARRNFLKSNPVELRHIQNEFIRAALAYPEVAFRMEHNGILVHDLKETELDLRIRDLFGKTVEGKLFLAAEDTPYIAISGYVGHPDTAKKRRGDQFFFVNRRFIKSGYLHHAIMTAYTDLLPQDTTPFYCIFLTIDPAHLDVNIHPQKTEIKFDDERTVYSLLHSVIRKGLGDLHQVPELPDEDKGLADIIKNTPLPGEADNIRLVQEPGPYSAGSAGGRHNTSDQESQSFSSRSDEGFSDRDRGGSSWSNYRPATAPDPSAWEKLYSIGTGKQENQPTDGSMPTISGANPNPELLPAPPQPAIFSQEEASGLPFMVQLHHRYILTQRKKTLIIIDQQYAHQRILYERLKKSSKQAPLSSQQLLFPRALDLSPLDYSYMKEIEPEIRQLGFDLKAFGSDSYMLHGVPAKLSDTPVEKLFDEIIAEVRESGGAQEVKEKIFDRLARLIAMRCAIQPGKKLSEEEMRTLINELFQCQSPGTNPQGKPVWFTVGNSGLAQHFQRNS